MALVNKPSIILLHGAWHGAWCWEGNFKDFFEAEGFEVQCPDLPSHGKRRGESPMWRNRISTYVDEIERLIGTIDHPPIVIGHSMGGFIVQHLLARGAPLAGAGLLASIPPSGAWRASITALRSNPWQFLKTSLNPKMRHDPANAARIFLGAEADQVQISRLSSHIEGGSHLALLDTLLLNLPGPPKNKVPSLVMGGEHDSLFPPISQKALASRLDAALHILPSAPHNIMMFAQWRTGAQHFLTWIESL